MHAVNSDTQVYYCHISDPHCINKIVHGLKINRACLDRSCFVFQSGTSSRPVSSFNKQPANGSLFSPMPVAPKTHQASRIFRTQAKPMTSHLLPGTQSPVFRSPGPKKSLLDDDSSTEEVSAAVLMSSKAEPDRKPLYLRSPDETRKPLYLRIPESKFRPLFPEVTLPETRRPVTRSRYVLFKPGKNL